MHDWLMKLQPNPWLTRKLMMLAILVSVGVAAFLIGRKQPLGATPPVGNKGSTMTEADLADYSRRVVAYVHENIPVTRAELGEYLIARMGADRLDFLVNRKIVEMECRKHDVYVTDAEVEARFQQDLEAFRPKISEQDFVNNVLHRFGKSLYEWKEDVLRPKIMMEKLVRPTVQITDKDLQEGFEARYGPKVQCRMIVLDGAVPMSAVSAIWSNASKGRNEFLAEAKKQSMPALAQAEGKVPPIHRFFGDKNLEDAAFRLKEGEVSALITMPDKSRVILYCEEHKLRDEKASFEKERQKIFKEMGELRLAQRIPEEFKAMRERAHPRLVLVSGQQAPWVVPPLPPTQPTSTVPPLPPLPPTQPISTVPPPVVPGTGTPPIPQEIAPRQGYAPLSVPAPLPTPTLVPPTPNLVPTEKK